MSIIYFQVPADPFPSSWIESILKLINLKSLKDQARVPEEPATWLTVPSKKQFT